MQKIEPDKYIIINFQRVPLTQPFRYKNRWWTKGIGVKDRNGITWGGWSLETPEEFIIIEAEELVSTEEGFLTRLVGQIV